MLIPNRHKDASSPAYRYSFQGQEKDDELKGEGNSLNYEYRMHDTRLGRFFATDPLEPEYPSNSPFAFSENRVIDMIEFEGLEAQNTNDKKDSFLDGWNKEVGKFNASFNSGVDEFFRRPLETSLNGTTNFLKNTILTVGDCIPGLTQVMGIENKTINSFSSLGNNILDIPNKSKSQLGELSASGTIFAIEVLATKKLPVAASLEFKVGEYAELRKVSRGTGLDAHHVGQSKVMEKLVKGYDPKTAPAILVPKIGHRFKKPGLGIVNRSTNIKEIKTVRNLVARDALELRRVYKVPNENIKELIKLNKIKYPEYLLKPKR